jgi:hypothetical protein
MNETKKTAYFAGAAVLLAIIAFVASPSRITPSAFLDQGEPFFPEFTDPNVATTLEVVTFDEATGAPYPFKVTFRDGRWTIPSHHDYPADAKDRLAQTAAGVIGIEKDDIRSDNAADHEACNVIDPLSEEATGAGGRGQRITLKDKDENVLADFIVGNEIKDRPGFRFARVPGQKRTYAVRMNIDISTEFKDWIETDLLTVEQTGIDEIILKDYSINERTFSINRRDDLILNLKDGAWEADRMKGQQQVDSTKMQALLVAIDSLAIVGVRPKPEGLTRDLKERTEGAKIGSGERRSLQSKGYYFTREGDMVSNEGELQVHTNEGVIYTIRFGEVLWGSGLAVSAGSEEEQEKTGAAENRYLFITAAFDPSPFPQPPAPTNTDFLNKPDSLLTDDDRQQRTIYNQHESWKRQIERGQNKSNQLNNRFADWYYVISSESFDKLNLDRSDLVVKKEDAS